MHSNKRLMCVHECVSVCFALKCVIEFVYICWAYFKQTIFYLLRFFFVRENNTQYLFNTSNAACTRMREASIIYKSWIAHETNNNFTILNWLFFAVVATFVWSIFLFTIFIWKINETVQIIAMRCQCMQCILVYLCIFQCSYRTNNTSGHYYGKYFQMLSNNFHRY